MTNTKVVRIPPRNVHDTQGSITPFLPARLLQQLPESNALANMSKQGTYAYALAAIYCFNVFGIYDLCWLSQVDPEA